MLNYDLRQTSLWKKLKITLSSRWNDPYLLISVVVSYFVHNYCIPINGKIIKAIRFSNTYFLKFMPSVIVVTEKLQKS